MSFMGKRLTKVLCDLGYTIPQRYTGFYSISHVKHLFSYQSPYYLECLYIFFFSNQIGFLGKQKWLTTQWFNSSMGTQSIMNSFILIPSCVISLPVITLPEVEGRKPWGIKTAISILSTCANKSCYLMQSCPISMSQS